MSQSVSSLMTSPVATVDADDTVAAVGEQLRASGLSFVPVVDSPSGAPLGIISAGDILQFEAARRDPQAVHAWEICSYKPVEVGPDASVEEVARLMLEQQIHHVLVRDDGGIKGVVSSLDYVRQFMEDRT